MDFEKKKKDQQGYKIKHIFLKLSTQQWTTQQWPKCDLPFEIKNETVMVRCNT